MSLLNDASLILVPSAIRTGEVLVQKPLPNKFADETGNYDGNDPQGSANLTFTRASNASRVNADGLVERVRTNLILQSNQFDTTWTAVRSTTTSGQSGYDGSSDAWLFESNTTANSASLTQTNTTSGVQSFSIYAKAETSDWLRIRGEATPSAYQAYFNLSTGSLGSTSSIINASITAVGGGWYRCCVSANATLSTAILSIANGDNNVTTNSGDSIYIQNAQLEQGDIATDYIPTTTSARSTFAGITVDGTSVPNVPRLDYSGGATCPSLLLEPQRTNLVLNTSFRTGWLFLSGGSMSYNTSVSPDGYTNAETLVGDGVNAHAAYTSVSVTSGTLYTFSVFAKANTQSLFRMRGFSVAAGGNINFDLSNGTISGATTDDDIIRSQIQDYGNGWYRCICVFEADGTGAALFGFDRAINSGGNLFDVYGPQIEAGSYATSLISTQGSAVTRLADYYTRSITPIASGSAFINITDNVALGAPGTHLYGPFALTSASLGLHLSRSNGTRLRLWTAAGAVIYSTTQTNLKLAITWNGTNVNVWENGVKVKSNYAYALTNVNQFVSSTSIETTSSIAQILMFNSVLTDAQLAELTTL